MFLGDGAQQSVSAKKFFSYLRLEVADHGCFECRQMRQWAGKSN